MSSFFSELKRRNVLRAGAFYAAAALLLVQIATLTELTRRGAALTTVAQIFEQAVATDPGYAAGWAGLSPAR